MSHKINFHFSGNIRSTLAFDGMSGKDSGVAKTQLSSNSTFGSRPPMKVPKLGAKTNTKQRVIQMKNLDSTTSSPVGKENVTTTKGEGKYGFFINCPPWYNMKILFGF